jgi:hypothetical protein
MSRRHSEQWQFNPLAGMAALTSAATAAPWFRRMMPSRIMVLMGNADTGSAWF